MIHYVLASHGNYAREALNSAKMICGEDTDRMNLLSVQDDGDGIRPLWYRSGGTGGKPPWGTGADYGGSVWRQSFYDAAFRLPGHGVCVSDRF